MTEPSSPLTKMEIWCLFIHKTGLIEAVKSFLNKSDFIVLFGLF